eukprot:COSAG02_NODE_1670_length_11394_cov_4.791855_13_plen_132_part_00
MHNMSTRANTIITFAITVLGVLAGQKGHFRRLTTERKTEREGEVQTKERQRERERSKRKQTEGFSTDTHPPTHPPTHSRTHAQRHPALEIRARGSTGSDAAAAAAAAAADRVECAVHVHPDLHVGSERGQF